MRKPLFFFVFFLLVEWEACSFAQGNQQIINDLKHERHRKRLFYDDTNDEGSTKWSIDLADMLNFDRLEYELEVDGKRLTKDEVERLLTRGKNEGKDAAEGTGGNDKYEEGEEIKAIRDLIEDENFKIQVQEYVFRYVNLFLNQLNLKDKKAPGELDEEVVDFNFVITGKDLKALQDLSNNFEKRNVLDQLYLIDSIISKGLRMKKKYSFYESIKSFLSNIEFPGQFFFSKSSYFYLFAGVGLSMVLMKNFIGLSYRAIAFILVNNLILMEGLYNYFREVKEANIADYVERMQYSAEYDVCSPVGQTIFGKLYNMFYENRCLTYHKSLQLNRADSISPLESILNAYAYYLVEIPCRILGSGVSAFVVNVNAYLPAVLRQIGQATTQFFVMAFLVFVFIIYFACPQFTIAVLGARVHINFGRFVRPALVNRQFRRIRQSPRSALNETEIENVNELQKTDRLEKGPPTIFEEVEDEDIMIEEIQESSTEAEVEVYEEAVGSDNDPPAPGKKNSSEGVETAEELLDELKTDE